MKFSAAVTEATRRFTLWISKADLDSQQIAETIENLNQGKAISLLDLQASTNLLKNGVNHYLLWHYLEGMDPNNPDENIRSVLDIMNQERSYCAKTVTSLKNLAGAHEIYKKFEGATVSSAIVSRGIHNAKWSRPERLRSAAFSCIAMMETGTLNLDPERLGCILALAHGNSIYMMRHFITDSAVHLPSSDIVRIVGNVGRVGISLLVSPASRPLIRQLSNSLRAVTYADFDGKRENNFTGTSLHLSFTPNEFPLDYGASGVIDHQVFYVESVVSVHDSGKWVADLDILGAFQRRDLHVLEHSNGLPDENRSTQAHVHSNAIKQSVLDSFVSVDTWEEVLDTPQRMRWFGPVVAGRHDSQPSPSFSKA
ncbi:hypothetical protein PG985_002968 [Apiospora marii]|uniref:uncharacterized protein n=1 Tax=Apiospora marii TaxID=335849 RepID=UPI00312EC4B3